MRGLVQLRLSLTLPFAVLPGRDRVHLVAGEDVRFALEAPGLEAWLPGLLASLDGRRPVDELVSGLSPERREQALEIFSRLLSERVLSVADALFAHAPERHSLLVQGNGKLARVLEELAPSPVASALPPIRVLCQADLDYSALLAFNAECLHGAAPFMWVSTAPSARAFVGPLHLPDAGPCLECLLVGFRRLSPAPEIYDALLEHAERGAALPASDFPENASELLARLVLWKAELASEPMPSAALYSLHVLERASLEISSHRVPLDPECRACGELR